MGMYTELFLQLKLKDDLPTEIVQTLRYMLDNDCGAPKEPPFDASRWNWMLRCSSHYHYPYAHSFLDEPTYNGDSYHFFVRCDFKNYSGELEGFLEWIAPYVETQDLHYQGHWMYEGMEHPKRIIFNDGVVSY